MTENLHRAFGVAPEDLACNRDGRLSERQQADMQGQLKLLRLVCLIVGPILLLALAIAVLLQSPTGTAVTAAMLLLFVLMFGNKARLLRRNLKTCAVVAYRGMVTKRAEKRRVRRPRGHGYTTTVRHFITIDGKSFLVEAKEYEAFHDGGKYIVYVAANSKYLVAAEPEE